MEDDSIELNTLNDNEHNARLDKKKGILLKKKAESSLRTIKKSTNEKIKGKKKLEKTLKSTSEKRKSENVDEDGKDEARNGVDNFKLNSFERNNYSRTSMGSSGTIVNKQAKFSSLFKNNHEIPKIGE